MNWFDVFSILFLILIAYIGSKRGLILEFFDLIILFAGLGLTFHLYGHLSKLILSFLAWDKTFCAWFSFFVIFIIIAGVLFFIALVLDRTVKLSVSLKSLNMYAGLLLAILKGVFILIMALVVILSMPIKKEDKKYIFSSGSAKILWNFYPPFKDVFDIVSPTFVNDYINDAIKTSKIIKDYSKKVIQE